MTPVREGSGEDELLDAIVPGGLQHLEGAQPVDLQVLVTDIERITGLDAKPRASASSTRPQTAQRKRAPSWFPIGTFAIAAIASVVLLVIADVWWERTSGNTIKRDIAVRSWVLVALVARRTAVMGTLKMAKAHDLVPTQFPEVGGTDGHPRFVGDGSR